MHNIVTLDNSKIVLTNLLNAVKKFYKNRQYSNPQTCYNFINYSIKIDDSDYKSFNQSKFIWEDIRMHA